MVKKTGASVYKLFLNVEPLNLVFWNLNCGNESEIILS